MKEGVIGAAGRGHQANQHQQQAERIENISKIIIISAARSPPFCYPRNSPPKSSGSIPWTGLDASELASSSRATSSPGTGTEEAN